MSNEKYIVAEYLNDHLGKFGSGLCASEKIPYVSESTHPRFKKGNRFDYGMLQIALKEGYTVEIRQEGAVLPKEPTVPATLAPSDTIVNKELFKQLTELFELVADAVDGNDRPRLAWPPVRKWYEREMQRKDSAVSTYYITLLATLEGTLECESN